MVSSGRCSHIEDLFPLLRRTLYEPKSPKTWGYNCIAWAAGEMIRRWWPDAMFTTYWPSGVPREETLDAFIKAFETLGYVPCKTEVLEPAFQKIAIYVKSDGKPTHAARQLSNGAWTSKLGDLEDIEHTLQGLEGEKYGKVVQIMKRPRS